MPEINFRWSLFLIVNNKQSVDVFVFFISCGNEEKGVVCDKKGSHFTRAAKPFVGNMNEAVSEDLAGVEDPNKGYFTVPWGLFDRPVMP